VAASCGPAVIALLSGELYSETNDNSVAILLQHVNNHS
jgi:hypothetical protein